MTEYLQKYIFVFENVISKEFCSEMITFLDNYPLRHSEIKRGNYVKCDEYFISNKNRPENNTIHYSFSSDITSKQSNKNYGITNSVIDNYVDKLNEYMKIILGLLPKNARVLTHKVKYSAGYRIRKSRWFTNSHFDGMVRCIKKNNIYPLDKEEDMSIITDEDEFLRIASVIITLNDDYDGGDFNFPDLNVKIHAPRGSILLFPPYWTHIHNVSQIQPDKTRSDSENSIKHRYTIQLWLLDKIEDIRF